MCTPLRWNIWDVSLDKGGNHHDFLWKVNNIIGLFTNPVFMISNMCVCVLVEDSNYYTQWCPLVSSFHAVCYLLYANMYRTSTLFGTHVHSYGSEFRVINLHTIKEEYQMFMFFFSHYSSWNWSVFFLCAQCYWILFLIFHD